MQKLGLDPYIESPNYLSERAAATGATVFLTNHSWNDNAVNKIRMIAGRGASASPFEIGLAWIQRYFMAASVSSTVLNTVVWMELNAPPPLIAIAVAAIATLSGASHKL